MPLAALYVCGCGCVRMCAGGGYANTNLESLSHTHARTHTHTQLWTKRPEEVETSMYHLKKKHNAPSKKITGNLGSGG